MFKVITIFLLHSLLNSADGESWIRSGYWFSGSEFPIPDINSRLFTHLVCAFARINSSSYEVYVVPSDESYMSTFTGIVTRKNPSAKTLLSILARENGELANSSTFYTAISQASGRQSFIKSSVSAARQYSFMGLDLFNVFPSTATDTANMELFLDEWREAVESEAKESKSNTSPLILSLGARYSPVFESMIYPISSIRKNFDWVHILSFDYHMPPKDRFTGPPAALYDPWSNVSTNYGVNEWINRGLPAKKLLLGLPYHGYAWTLADSSKDAIGAPAKGGALTPDNSVSYRYIKKYIKSYGVKPLFNSTYMTNYCKIGSTWIGYDDVEVIKAKVSYAKQRGLLGYSIFQVPNDDTDWILSRTAKEEALDHNKLQLLKILLPITAVTVCLLVATICYLRRKLIMPKVNRTLDLLKRNKSRDLQVFTLSEIQEATDNFSAENKLGEGGFGPVYKGELRNGLEVAVKRLSRVSTQGTEEFKNELAITTRLQHVNLVKVVGICTSREEKILVYEYMPNLSLDIYLFDPGKKLCLDWQKRVQIIEGITQGLLYLQEYSAVSIVHRDLKASNILLDKEMKPKISDFGIARVFQNNKSAASTSRIVGTYGHIPPEYVKGGIYSKKYDVYSFGILLLQIISGKKIASLYGLHNNMNLLEHAYQLWKNDESEAFMDPSLDDTASSCKMTRCMHVALLCVQEKWEDRPSMLEVSSMLRNEAELMHDPKTPAFAICHSSDEREICSSEVDVCSINMLTMTQEVPR